MSYRQAFDRDCAQVVFSDPVVVDLHVRADMHANRHEVDGPLQNSQRMLPVASAAHGSWSADGSCDQDGLRERWSGSGPLAFSFFGEGAPHPPAPV